MSSSSSVFAHSGRQLVRNACLLFLLVCLIAPVKSLKCLQCLSAEECRFYQDPVECSDAQVQATASNFPTAYGAYSNSYSCVTYKATLKNKTQVQISGCMYSTNNVCEAVESMPAVMWSCRFCDTLDMCNTGVVSSGAQSLVATISALMAATAVAAALQ